MVWTAQELNEWTKGIVLDSMNERDVHYVPKYQQSNQGNTDMFGDPIDSPNQMDPRILGAEFSISAQSATHGSPLPFIGVKRKEASDLDMSSVVSGSTPYDSTNQASRHSYRDDSFIHTPPSSKRFHSSKGSYHNASSRLFRGAAPSPSDISYRVSPRKPNYVSKDASHPYTLPPILPATKKRKAKRPARLLGFKATIGQQGIQWTHPSDPFIFMWDWVERDRDLVESLII